MTKFPIPSSPAKKILDIDNFNGVDFTSKVPDISRSNNALNVIKRNGYHQIRKAFRQYVTSKAIKNLEEVVPYDNISGAKLLINLTDNPEQLTNEEFREKHPDFEEGKVVLGNQLGAMFIERNNPYQYGLFYVAPTTYGGNDLECMGYQVSKNLFNINDLSLATGVIDYSTGVITVNQYANGSTNTLKEIAPSLVAGETYTLSLVTTALSNQYIYLVGTSKAWRNGRSYTITQADLDAGIVVYGEYESNETHYISNIQIEKGTVATEYTPYVYDDGVVFDGNLVADLAPFTIDQWSRQIVTFDEDYKGHFYKVVGETLEERVPKLVDKITGELWEETSDGYHKVSDEHEMYLKISSRSIFGGEGIEDYFQVFAEASLLGVASEEIRYYTEDVDRENKPLEYYKKVIFNDKPHYFTTNGIVTVEAKQVKKLDGTITIDIECTTLGSYYYPAKTPIYRIGCDPEMTKFTQNEDVNLINHMVEVGYKGDGTTKRFKLLYNTHGYLNNEEIHVRIMQNDGSWIEYGEYDDVFSRDTSGDYIVFVDAPTKPPLDGYDNVFIKQRYGELNLKQFEFDRKLSFEKSSLNDNVVILNSATSSISQIDYAKDPYIIANGKIIRQNDSVENPYPNGKAWYWETTDANNKTLYKYRNSKECPTQTLVFDETFSGELTEEEYAITRNVKNLILYGDGEEKTLFINGDKNIQVYSALNDITYWPSSNYLVIGDESDISGFGLSNGYLLTFKKGNNSIFVQQGAVVNNKTTYPVVYSEDATNVLSEPIQLDDALYIFTKDGLQEVAYTENNLLLVNRSYFIDKKLKDMNFDTLTWFKWDDNLYFMMKDKLGDAGTHIFVADLDDNSRVYEKSSSVGNSFSTGIAYQYEWYYLYTRFNPIILTDYEWEESGFKYLLGYNKDGLFSVVNDDRLMDYPKLDVEIFVNSEVPMFYEHGIQAYWETPFIDMDDITKAKTIRGIYLNTKGNIGDNLIVFAKNIDDGYDKIGEIKYQLPPSKNVMSETGVLVRKKIAFPIDVEEGETYTLISNKPIYWFKVSDDRDTPYNGGEHYDLNGFTEYTFVCKNKGAYIFIGIDEKKPYELPTSMDAYSSYRFQVEKGDKNTGFEEPKPRQDDFPRRVYIKDKIRKFMNVKYLFTNNEHYDEPWTNVPSNFSFNRLSIEYQDAGKYRGE